MYESLRVDKFDMVVYYASCGDILHAGLAKRENRGPCDPGLMAHADAPVPGGQLDISLGDRCLRDGWHDAEARRHLPEQNGLVLATSINRDSRCRDGRAGRGRQRPDAAGHRWRWLA